MKSIKDKLEYHYKKFDRTQIYPDPLIFPHRYKNERDIELSAFISSIFAYGNIKQIMKSLEIIHDLLGISPVDFIENLSDKSHITFFNNFKHRFYTGTDVRNLFLILKRLLQQNYSLKNIFLQNFSEEDRNIKNSLSYFISILSRTATENNLETSGIKYMFSNPQKGSACKRMNLFLRWMVRKDELDFGLWNEVRANQLIIPVDTHVAKISRRLGLTTKQTISWKMAEEITENLQKFDKNDPVKYDFAICHIGMRKIRF